MKPQRINLCECGCGQGVKPGRRYVNHHSLEFRFHWKGKKQSKATNEKRSESLRKAVELNGGGFGKGWHHTEEWKENNSKRHKGNKHALGNKHTEEWKENNSKLHKGKVTSEATKAKMSAVAKGRVNSEESKRKNVEAHRGKKASIETKQKMTVAQKRLWADPVYRNEQQSKMARGARLNRPNKQEIKLLNLLQTLYPNDWEFVGDGELIIAGKNPDFMHVGDRCLLIELFGDWWHRNDSPRKRMALFQPLGFRTLVIWERELGDQKTLTHKINRFVNR